MLDNEDTFAKPLSWEKELSVIIFLSKHQEWVLWEEKTAHHPLIVKPFIIIIFSLMIVHIMRLLSYLQAPVLLVGTL